MLPCLPVSSGLQYDVKYSRRIQHQVVSYIGYRVREEGGHGVESHRPDLGLVDCTTVLSEIERGKCWC